MEKVSGMFPEAETLRVVQDNLCEVHINCSPLTDSQAGSAACQFRNTGTAWATATVKIVSSFLAFAGSLPEK
jgi:hypothetical protein